MNELEKTVMDMLWWHARSEVFEEENAKLRELVRDMYEVAHRRTAYGWVAVEEAMRELGIEVDDE